MSFLKRFLPLLLILVLAPAGFATGASANPKFAAIAVDARTGAIIYDSDSNATRHPASLTKMMTLYLVFQDLKAKKITLKTPLKVSARAAGMAPSKMGLKPGSTITVEEAIKALVVKSANDAAATIAENLGGSESAFAARMTKVARSIGMNKTTYANASGLPNPRQITTARDQATLGLRLMRDYPQYYPYFRLTAFNFRGKVIRGHNRLLGSYQGTDGIKTGYINASGFNLVSSVRRGDRRLVGVVLGGTTAARRDAYMMQMLTTAFEKAKEGNTIAALPGSSKGAIDPLKTLKAEDASNADKDPNMVPSLDDDDKIGLATAAAEAAQAANETVIQQQSGKSASVLEATLNADADEDEGEGDSDGGGGLTTLNKLPFQVKKAKTQADVDAMTVSSVAPAWAIEVGDFNSKNSAEQVAKKLKAASVDSKPVPLTRNGKTIYRLLVSGFDEAAAKNTCAAAIKLGKNCSVLAPQG